MVPPIQGYCWIIDREDRYMTILEVLRADHIYVNGVATPSFSAFTLLLGLIKFWGFATRAYWFMETRCPGAPPADQERHSG